MAMKILLADDSMTAQNMGKKILTDAGFEVIAVSNGAAALKKITAENPDIIILDVFMPGYTGLEVCEKLKNNPDTSRKPVLLTVGKMEPFNPDDSNRVRAEGVMIKPFEATDLTAAVEAIAKRFNIPRNAAPPPPPPPPPKAPESYRSYEETVMMSQDELRKSMGISDNGDQVAEAAGTANYGPAAVAVATPAMDLGVDSSAIVTEHEEITPSSTVAPVVEVETPAKPVESETHSPFSHATVAREVIENPAAPVTASEPAAWDPVLDGISISPTVVTTSEPEPAQPVVEAQPMFGLEYAVPASVAEEKPSVVETSPVVSEEPQPAVVEEATAAADPVEVAPPASAIEEETAVPSPNAYLAEASAAMGLETSHELIEAEPVVDSTPGFEPNVAPPVQVETHAENGVEPGIEQASPELTVPPDPALVGGTESFSEFTTHFGVQNPEVIPVGIVPELMPDAESSYEYRPPEEGHAFEGEAAAAEAEAKSEITTEPVAAVPPTASWEMVPVEAAPEPAPLTPEPVAEEPAAVPEEAQEVAAIPEVHEPVASAEESVPEAPVAAELAAAPEETPFDPDATQALPEEFFTSSEPQLETTAELVGASIPETVSEPAIAAAERPATVGEHPAPVVEETPAPIEEVTQPDIVEPQAPAIVQEPAPSFEPAPAISPAATEPAILSVGPEPPAVTEEPVAEEPAVEQHLPVETPAIAAAAAAGASVLGEAITEQLHAAAVASEPETALGDQTQVFIASAVARVLDRMKPTLIEEIAREMSNRRKPRKDPEE